MQPVTSNFLAALRSPQRVQVRGWVDKGGRRLASSIPIVGGTLNIDASQITRRRCTLELAPRMPTGTYTDAPTLGRSWQDPIAHYGQEITLEWGLTFTEGTTEWVRLGVFRIDDVEGSLLDDDTVQVRGVSRESFVADGRFGVPQTRSGPSAQSLIADLIREAIGPKVEVVMSASIDRRVPPTVWDEDRWEAITGLAQSIGAVVYADARGRFVIRDAPSITTPPVWRIDAGPGGVLVAARSSSSRTNAYNAISVSSSNPSSDVAPVHAAVVDGGVASPTRYGSPLDGRWGKRWRKMSLPTITSQQQARDIAVRNLSRYVGAASSLDISAVPNVALDAGDVVEIITDPRDPAGSVRRHVIDSMSLSLTPGGRFTLSTRDVADVIAEDYTGD